MCGLLFLLLCQFSQVFAQTREISEQEFKKVEDSAYQKSSAENRRSILNSKHFHHINDKEPYFQRNVTTERTANGYYEVLEDTKGKEIERTETIEINKRKYLKKNNGNWEDITESKTGRFGVLTGEIKNEKTVEGRYLGKQTLNGQTVDVYEQKTTRKYEDRDDLSVYEEKIWIDQKGRCLKTETKSRIGDKHIFQMTVEYEYDPNIKIIAPKIKQK